MAELNPRRFQEAMIARLYINCPGPTRRLSALSVYLCKSDFYGAFVWARRALNSQKRWFPARAVFSDDVVTRFILALKGGQGQVPRPDASRHPPVLAPG